LHKHAAENLLTTISDALSP